jgi:hypothetical protein
MDSAALLANLHDLWRRRASYAELRRTVWCDQRAPRDELETRRDGLDVCISVTRDDIDDSLEELFAALLHLPRQQVSA